MNPKRICTPGSLPPLGVLPQLAVVSTLARASYKHFTANLSPLIFDNDPAVPQLVPSGSQSIDPVLSSTNITSVLGICILASQVTAIVRLVMPKIFIRVIGKGTLAVPVTVPPDSAKLRVIVPEP